MANNRSSRALADQLGRLYRLGTSGPLSDGLLLECFRNHEDPQASEAAFAALVERHGAMVLGVCTRVLGDRNDAHDAFQATFLILVRKADSIRRGDSLGSWLFGIARRVATRARLQADRRIAFKKKLQRERSISSERVADVAACEPEPDYGPLIAEIDRLPERFRAPIVLHYFEGLSTEATAQRLGCARGTVLSRLARARDRLRIRLGRRGISLEATLPLAPTAGRLLLSAAVPSALVQSTVRAATCFSLGAAAMESVVPASVANLSRGVIRTLLVSRVRMVAALVVLTVAGVSLGLAATSSTGEPPRPPTRQAMPSRQAQQFEQGAPAKPDKKAPKDSKIIRGRVLDPDGKPVAGARIALDSTSIERHAMLAQVLPPVCTSGADGRFELFIPRGWADVPSTDPLDRPVISALIRGFGPEWIKVDPVDTPPDLTLRLRRDDVPIEGRVIGIEGQPVPGLTVSVFRIWDYPHDFFKKVSEDGGEINPGLWSQKAYAWFWGEQHAILAARTGPDGRFRLNGVGRDRLVTLVIDGESIEQAYAMVFTASDPAYKPLLQPPDETDYKRQPLFGPRFDLVVGPGRTIEGVIRDGETGRPLGGTTLKSWETEGPTTSDAQGRFRLTGQPTKKEHHIQVVADAETYVKVVKVIADPRGLEPIRADITMRRGVTVDGRVTDRASGRAVKSVVRYYPFRDNPHLDQYPDASFFDNADFDETEFTTDDNGRFRAVVLPGGGILAVQTPDPNYLTAAPLAPKVAGNVLSAGNFNDSMSSYHALVAINAQRDEKSVIPEITLVPGRRQRVEVNGPDGRPVSGTRILSHQSQSGDGDTVPGTEFPFVHRNPGKAETVVIIQVKLGLGAIVDIKGDEPDPIRVKLHPLGAVVGRVVDEDGRPRASVPLHLEYELKTKGETVGLDAPTESLTTGRDGRFRIDGIVPGVPCVVEVLNKNPTSDENTFEGYLKNSTLKPGEVQDWGDVRVRRD